MNAKTIALIFAIVACICLCQASETFPRAYCIEPKEPGPCRGAFPFYVYDPETNACEEFIYGGCLGNHNRFATEEACKEACVLP